MENRDRCPHCGALLRPDERFCSQCGVSLTGDAASASTTASTAGAAEGEWAEYNGAGANAGVGVNSGWHPGMRPVTIEQLKDFCAYNEMPLERMRFFVGEDYREPRAFGIFQEGDRFVVYKNKSDGSRAVRYDGPDEAHAVGELYDKLLDECHQRDIWPDGKPEGAGTRQEAEKRWKTEKRRLMAIAVVGALLMGTIGFIFMKLDEKRHANDGYYRFGNPGIYYCYGDDWYYDDGHNDWVLTDSGPYDNFADRSDYYIGDTYDRSWGYSDFTDSQAWAKIEEENRTSSSDYSSWDSNDTDWDSDW